MSEVVRGSLQAGREAASRYAWADAYTLLTEADGAGEPLSGNDLELLGHSALWVGRLPESIEAYERSYARYLEEGDNRRAAAAALFLASEYRNKLQQAVSMGWHQRARRLLEDEPDSAERGFLELQIAQVASARGNVDEALDHIRRALEIARRVDDRDLAAQATLREGIALVKKGEVDAGLALIDEVSASAVAGELSPYSTAVIYCSTIDACRDLADYGRAAEWTDTAMRWCERQEISGFPGMCRVDRAEIMRIRGAWDEAGRELALACEELEEWNPRVAGAAFYEIGEIRLRTGDLEAAEDAFRRASELGREVQPGLALLRFAQGKTEAAAGAIKRALADESWSRLGRARLLPAQVEIAIAARDLRTARAAAEELRSIAEDFKISEAQTPALEAAVQLASGAVKLAEEDADGALACLRRAVKLWREIDAPYEAARTRVLIGSAYLAQGDEGGAQEELDAARAAFERLGAAREARRAADLLSGRRRRTFVFTDIVDSTRLAEVLGEERWKRVLGWHDELVRGAFARHGGEIVKQTGDGFFAAFENPGAALEAAIEVQRALVEQGIAPDVRIGLHAAEAGTAGDDYTGAGVHAAQRISALAGAGEILASKDTVDALAVSTLAARTETLKGLSEPVEIVSIDWR